MNNTVVYGHEAGISAQVIADSFFEETGKRITTLQVSFYKSVDAEVEKHRLLSSNTGSDRARPVSKTAKEVRENPYIPPEIYENKKGMQGDTLIDDKKEKEFKKEIERLANAATSFVEEWGDVVHKQHLNRYLLPFLRVDKVVTATEWDNFFELRTDHDADPNLRILAELMQEALNDSTPNRFHSNEYWHAPYIEGGYVHEDWNLNLLKASVSRCARVSYTPFDMANADMEKDLRLFNDLYTNKHMSPFEHVAKPMQYSKAETMDGCLPEYWEDGVTHMGRNTEYWSGNFKGWVQYRHLLE